MKTLLVVNPTAGNGLLKRKWKSSIYPFLKNNLPFFDYQFTKNKGHAVSITREAIKQGYELIVSMGGDGTLNEVVNGFFDKEKLINKNAALGILPFGSGGDFIRTLKIPRNYKKAVSHLKSKTHIMADVGLVRFQNKNWKPRYFINIAEIGLGANIMSYVNTKNKKLPALYRYLSGTLQGFATHKNIKISLTTDQKQAKDINLTNLIIANGQYFGRGMRPAPKATIDDGLLDVIIIKNLNWKNFLIHFPKIYGKKKNISKKYYETYTARKILIKVLDKEKELNCEMDGENHGIGNTTITLIPKTLKVRI